MKVINKTREGSSILPDAEFSACKAHLELASVRAIIFFALLCQAHWRVTMGPSRRSLSLVRSSTQSFSTEHNSSSEHWATSSQPAVSLQPLSGLKGPLFLLQLNTPDHEQELPIFAVKNTSSGILHAKGHSPPLTKYLHGIR